MTELNVQNPEFRWRIRWVCQEERGLVACFRVNNVKTPGYVRIYSPNKVLDANQRWFTRSGREMKSMADLESYCPPVQ